ncbi:MAG: CinA family protein [Methylococcaceae bacterium]
MIRPNLYKCSEQVGMVLSSHKLKLVTAESCTGGELAQYITAVPGSSDWFEGGFVVYSNEAKHVLLGVDPQLIEDHGAVSEQTVRAMTAGALLRCTTADVAVAISGIAGPTGGTAEKPVGTVFLAWEWRDEIRGRRACRLQLEGDRLTIREQAVEAALRGLCESELPPEATL